MLKFYHSDGLSWSSLFSIRDEIEKENVLKDIYKIYFDYDSQNFKNQILSITDLFDLEREIADSSIIQEACEYVVLKFMIDQTTLAKELLLKDDFEKSQNLLKRRQLDSKILKSLLNSFSLLINNRENRYDSKYIQNLKTLFILPILEQVKNLKEESIDREFNGLKKIIEKVCSGVKPECYINAKIDISHLIYNLKNSLNEFVKENFDYDFSLLCKNFGNESSTLLNEIKDVVNNKIMQLALYNDEKFWKKHQDFSVIAFINEIEKLNGERHAEKVLTYIINNLKEFPNMEMVLKNKFPFYMSKYDDLVIELENQAQRFTFKKLEQYCDISKVKEISLCYPMSEVNEESIIIGEKLWRDFICKYNYPNNYEKVINYLNNEVNLFSLGETKNDGIAIILDGSIFRYSADNEDRRLFKAYHEDCFSAENIWKRVYLRVYAVTKLSDEEDVQFSFIQRIFIDLIKTIEKNLGICTIHQLDTKERDEKYEKLKKNLKYFNIEISDSKKENYIISLLDRDTAVIEESMKFPALEQVGDAIYNFAVAEGLFYNPNIKNMSKKFEDYKRAESQVLIAKKIGLNHLFIHNGLPAKYIEFDTIFFDYETFKDEHLQTMNNEKYLADSLEMIIASIYFDKGLMVAIDFAKTLLKKTFPNDFPNEIRLSDENRLDESISEFYWMQILPAPHSNANINQVLMWDALNKMVLTISIGCEDKEKRKFITINYNNINIYGERDFYGINWVFYKYLTNGLNSVLEKYGNIIRENYSNKK